MRSAYNLSSILQACYGAILIGKLLFVMSEYILLDVCGKNPVRESDRQILRSGNLVGELRSKKNTKKSVRGMVSAHAAGVLGSFSVESD